MFAAKDTVNLQVAKVQHTLREMATSVEGKLDTQQFLQYCVLYEEGDKDMKKAISEYRGGRANDNASRLASHIKAQREERAERAKQAVDKKAAQEKSAVEKAARKAASKAAKAAKQGKRLAKADSDVTEKDLFGDSDSEAELFWRSRVQKKARLCPRGKAAKA